MIVSAWGTDIYTEAKILKKNRKWVIKTMNEADIITSTSKTLKKHIIDNFEIDKNKAINFYWGQDLGTYKRGYESEVSKLREKYGLRPDTFIVLSSRNMKPSYGIHYIIKVIPKVIKNRKNVNFIFLRGYGIDEYVVELKELIKKLEIEDRVIFIPEFLNDHELAALNNLADVVISLPESDQLSSAVKEAMACGAIPMVHDLKVYHELIEDGQNGFLVNRNDLKDLSQKIIYCIDNHLKLKEEFAKINREILEETSDWEKNSKSILELYKNLIKSFKK
jgi:glycosyltransferase involved in cell wall biosynthesis